MTSSQGMCHALNISDQSHCQEAVSSANGLFCSFHSKQCQGLYRGYKRRNAQLERLDEQMPDFLTKSKTALANQDFREINTESELREIFDFLYEKFCLLHRVITARKVHHSRFFSLDMDYGHQNYLDRLSSQRFLVIRALERLMRRTADVLFEQQRWFEWVRQAQDAEEAQRENEKTKVKLEAALFKRHQMEVQLHLQEVKAKERLKRQDADLEQAYKERMAEMTEEEAEDEWDPIESVVDQDRGTFVDLIRHFLFTQKSLPTSSNVIARQEEKAVTTDDSVELKAKEDRVSIRNDPGEAEGKDDDADGEQILKSGKRNETKSRKARPKEAAKAVDKAAPKQRPAPMKESRPKELPESSSFETVEQIRQRLREGSQIRRTTGWHMAGTISNPAELKDRTAPLPEEQIDLLLQDISEVKLLLFCRLLLSHASLLRPALEADSVEEFLNNSQVTGTDLRDVCFKLEKPELREIRDACADLGRDEEECDETAQRIDEADSEDEDMKRRNRYLEKVGMHKKVQRSSKDRWSSKREKKAAELAKNPQIPEAILESFADEVGNTLIDFGDIDEQREINTRKTRIRICGRYIYNYPSEKRISRSGWLQFCVIAKDSDLHKAIELCRNWDEFWELNILALYHYFPSGSWSLWRGDQARQQLLQLGLIPYYHFQRARETSISHQTGARNQHFRRAHAIREFRNFMCAHIRRNDPVSRRFLQYISMQCESVLVLVRDAKTGRIVKRPPKHSKDEEKDTWLKREKIGMGRASKNEWLVTSEVGPEFFEWIDEHRDWHFKFNDYYDVIIWDLLPGEPEAVLYNIIHETLIKAHQCWKPLDLYRPCESILRTLTRDPITAYARDIQIGEDVPTLWDEVEGARLEVIQYRGGASPEWRKSEASATFYQEADALEDAVLFGDNNTDANSLFKGAISALDRYVRRPPDWGRFIEDLSTTEEDSNYSDSEHAMSTGDTDATQISDRNEGDVGEGDDWEDLSSSSDLEDPPATMHGVRVKSRRKVSDDNSLASSSNQSRHSLDALISKQDMQDLEVLKGWESPYNSRFDRNPEADFMTFLDREKSKPFKESWHAADLTPGALERLQESRELIKRILNYKSKNRPFQYLQFLRFLDVHPEKHRRTEPDMIEARAMMSVFFPSVFFESEIGAQDKASLIVDQERRARMLPPIVRSHISCKDRPAEFFDDFHAQVKGKFKRLPKDADNATRPIIARLCKAGIIDNAITNCPVGQAIAGKEPGRQLDFYVDFRKMIKDITLPPEMQEPPTTEQLLSTARSFNIKHPKARFAVLRLWSAPHFYPLMIGFEQRYHNSFADLLGRSWVWRFVPKDMPYSDRSIHYAARLRIKPFQRQLGENVFIKRDLFLVMGEDESNLFKMATSTTFAIQTNPWRLEVDMWKSFVNIDLAFLEDLGKKTWLD